MIEVPFQGSWWVRPGEILAGCYPLRYDGKFERLLGLVEIKVDAVINLMEFEELSTAGHECPCYADTLGRLVEADGRSLLYHQLPIKDVDVPTRKRMAYILRAIDSLLYEGRVVYLHCRGGHGRTGTVVGCWFKRHGFSADDALDFMKASRAGAGINSPAPQTKKQIDFIKKWTEVKEV